MNRQLLKITYRLRMSSQNNFLDTDNISLEGNLKFVRNDFEENFQQYFGETGNAGGHPILPPRDYKIVLPIPGCCIKTFKVNTNEKYFINVCQTEEIPAPEDLTEAQLAANLKSDQPSSFRIPMSIAQPRTTKDKSNNPVDAVDIALNPNFFAKIEKSLLFRDFFLALIAEALNEKYNVQIKIDKVIILNNRKFIGNLVMHTICNSDIKRLMDQTTIASEENTMQIQNQQASASVDTTKLSVNPLIEEIVYKALETETSKEKSEQVRTDEKEQRPASANQQVAGSALITPEFKLRVRLRNEQVEEIQAEFYLPKCLSSHEITLDVGEDRILLASTKHGYIFDKFLDYQMNQDRASAIFDKTSRMLQLRVPAVPTK
uniref:PIH1 domain-containing protein 1 n=1 Tax=Glossina pallidipes TaxID=7398 RepID=A0A1B0ADZ4_GLOPL